MMKTRPGNEKMLNTPSWSPANLFSTLLSHPALGPASIIHASAPRYGGVMKAPSVSARTSPLPGMFVRDTAQAIGTATTVQAAVTARAITTEFQNAAI